MAFSLANAYRAVARPTITVLNYLTPLLDLGFRLYIARVFWQSGVSKYACWDCTLDLFRYEYQVPLFSPELAAYLATGLELAVPVLLVVGLGSRIGALSLFILNYVASISYPDISPAGTWQHVLWGMLLLVTVLHGPGKLSLDYLLRRKFLGPAE